MHLYRFGYILSPALKQYSSKADKNEDKNKSNTKKTAASMKSDKMLWKCYTVYNEHLKRDFTTILRDCTQSPNKTLYLSNELQNFSIPSLIFFSLSILTTSNTVALLRFSSLHAFFSFSENFSFFSTEQIFHDFPNDVSVVRQIYIYVENYTSNQTAREKKTKLVL